ncbi:hypothetical protein BH23ACT5_BH23ACT5_04280 [soil metagenome]
MIRFSILGIPVKIRPTFWLVAGFLGFGIGDTRLLVVWVVIVFLSVLAHELGHALTARRFGAEVDITLTTLGGLTAWRLPQGEMTPGRRAIVAAAGSAVGIVLGLAILGAYLAVGSDGGTSAFVVTMIVWVNVGWGVLNWLPIRPLDGGHLVTSLLELAVPKRAERIADVIFMISSLAALAAAVRFRLFFVMALAALMLWWEVSRHLSFTGTARPRGPVEFSYDEPNPTRPADEPDPTRPADDPDPAPPPEEIEPPERPAI